jgi:hypothetical protein
MRQLLTLACLTALVTFPSVAGAANFVGETYTRYGVYAGVYSQFQYVPDAWDINFSATQSHFDDFLIEKSIGGYATSTHGEARFLPSQISLRTESTVSGRGSAAAAEWYYFHVNTLTMVEFRSVASFTSFVWWDQILTCLYNPNIVAQFNSNNGTQNGVTYLTLVPNIRYRLYTGLNRNNLSYGNEAFNTDSIYATLSVLGTRTLKFYDPTFTGDWSTRTMDVQVYQGGLLVETQLNVPMLADGSFAFAPVTRGQADVRFKGTHWLSKTVTGLMLTDEVLGLEPLDLVNGDIDRDGEVGPGDFEAVVATFGTTGPADIDGDGEVGPSDFETVVAHFGLADE